MKKLLSIATLFVMLVAVASAQMKKVGNLYVNSSAIVCAYIDSLNQETGVVNLRDGKIWTDGRNPVFCVVLILNNGKEVSTQWYASRRQCEALLRWVGNGN